MRSIAQTSSDLVRYVLLFSAMYSAFGMASPFLPTFLASRNISAEQIGLILSLSTFVRIISGPIAGRIADYLDARREVLAICCLGAAVFAVAFIPAYDFTILLAVALAQAALLAPTTTLADALALRRASPSGNASAGFEYGWVRGAGSAAFIAGTLISGQAVGILDQAAALGGQAIFLMLAFGVAFLVPRSATHGRAREATTRAVSDLVRNPPFLWLILVAATVLGSHAMHDTFAMIAWNAAGISPGTGAILWSASVASEVVIFFLIGPWVLRKISSEWAMTIAALAAVLRWTVMGTTSNVLALALVEPLHGLSFALLHLACMRILVQVTPAELSATAQAIYAFGIAITTAAITLMSGYLYAELGAGGFYVMAGLSMMSLPFVWLLACSIKSRTAGECTPGSF
jgi:MFS transporter, PPP family, 3-phenylpropionic acid transporter